MSTGWTPFASATKSTIEIPESGGKNITIRALGWRELQKAQDVSMSRAGQLLATMGGAQALGGAEAMAKAADAEHERAKPDPLQTHDPKVLIEYGVVKWPDDIRPDTVLIDQMKPGFVAWLARQIYDLSRPETADERKND